MMFNDKTYIEVNRDERFFCALLAHALLASSSVRRSFSDLVQSKLNFGLDPDNLEVFLEAAALRDYWNDLGSPSHYEEKTHSRRMAVLETILKKWSLPPQTIQKYDFFWTSRERGKEKLWNPGHWSLEEINKIPELKRLDQVKWAFNAIPDIMVTSARNVLIIEAKVESGEGRNGKTGYDQMATQKVVADLLKSLVPQFQNSTFYNTTLTSNRKSGLTWKEVINLCDTTELDDFSKRALAQLSKRQEKRMGKG